MKKRTRTYYDEFSAQYEKERGNRYHTFLDSSELAAAAPYCRDSEILEVGCGTGLVLKPLSRIAAKATGLDLSGEMLAHAAARGLTVVQASATAIPFADNSFDCVVSFKVLAHIEEIRTAVSECARVLRPGGHLVLEFYNRHSIRHLIKRIKPAQKVASATTDDQVYLRYDSVGEIRSFLPPYMKVVDVTGIRCLAPTHHFYNVPVVGPVTVRVERYLPQTAFGRFGGFLVVAARKEQRR